MIKTNDCSLVEHEFALLLQQRSIIQSNKEWDTGPKLSQVISLFSVGFLTRSVRRGCLVLLHNEMAISLQCIEEKQRLPHKIGVTGLFNFLPTCCAIANSIPKDIGSFFSGLELSCRRCKNRWKRRNLRWLGSEHSHYRPMTLIGSIAPARKAVHPLFHCAAKVLRSRPLVHYAIRI
jgi:hypothetical protein